MKLPQKPYWLYNEATATFGQVEWMTLADKVQANHQLESENSSQHWMSQHMRDSYLEWFDDYRGGRAED